MTEHFDDPFLLANALLDGELTDEEAARATADPDVMAEVEALRALQADVRDTGSAATPSDAARESAIAAAMAAFTTPAADAIPGEVLGLAPERTAPEPARRPAPTVTPMPERRRPITTWFLGAAAAAVVALAVGAVIVQTRGGGDDSLANDARESTTELAGAPSSDLDDSIASAEIADETGDAASAQEFDAAASADDGGAAEDDAMLDVTAESSMEEGADDVASEQGDEAESQQPIVVAPDVDPSTVPDADELVAVVAALLDDRELGLLPPSPNTACAFGDDRLGGSVLALLPFDTDARRRDLFVGVDDFAETALAIDPDSCEIVLEAPLD